MAGSVHFSTLQLGVGNLRREGTPFTRHTIYIRIHKDIIVVFLYRAAISKY